MLQEPPEIPASIVLQKTGSSTLRSKTLFCCYLSVNKRLSLVQCEQVPVARSYGFSEQSLCHHGVRDSLEACDVGACHQVVSQSVALCSLYAVLIDGIHDAV